MIDHSVLARFPTVELLAVRARADAAAAATIDAEISVRVGEARAIRRGARRCVPRGGSDAATCIRVHDHPGPHRSPRGQAFAAS